MIGILKIIAHKVENPWRKKDSGPSPLGNSDLEKLLKMGKDKFDNKGKNNQNKLDNIQLPTKRTLMITFLIFFCGWLTTGFYTVDTNEEAVITRFGKLDRNTLPGLNYHLPEPIESVTKINVTRLHREIIGLKVKPNILTKNESSDLWSEMLKNHQKTSAEPIIKEDNTRSDEEQMLTGDENMIDLRFFVQWYIKDAEAYIFNLKDDSEENTVRVIAESVMREVIGKVKLYDALSDQREKIEGQVLISLKAILDSYNSGIAISSLGILYSYVAPEVMDAYRDVQSAKANKEREINNAFSYRNKIIPRSRGEAKAVLEKAEAYRESVIKEAEGETNRYAAILKEYQQARDVTIKRIYIDTMKKLLSKTNKVLIDQSQANNNSLPLMNLNELMKQNNKTKKITENNSNANSNSQQ